MKLLLDTQAALWSWIAPEKLSDDAATLIENTENEIFFSQVSTWEICLKHQIGKLPLPEPPATYLPARIHEFGFTYVPIEDTHLFQTSHLPRFHRDPFDWLLIATAQILQVPILTADRHIANYPVETIACGR